MAFSIHDYITEDERILWSGKNIGNPHNMVDVIITPKRVLYCREEEVHICQICAITEVVCDKSYGAEYVKVRISSASGFENMILTFRNAEEIAKQFVQILLKQMN